jgi:ABC-type iron transport system FetAB permease component
LNRLALEALCADLPAVDLSPESADEIAALARIITQVRARKAGIVQDEAHARPYEACPPDQREAMRFAVIRVVQALVLLGYIESPGAIVSS